ncbi:MAG: hypothetical protein MUP41_04440 [Desulfobacterales bacterium]|nr:hypothetical protein [Desulfobacterales bacterium]
MVVEIDLHLVSPFILRIDLLIFHSSQKINATTCCEISRCYAASTLVTLIHLEMLRRLIQEWSPRPWKRIISLEEGVAQVGKAIHRDQWGRKIEKLGVGKAIIIIDTLPLI